MDGSFKQAGKTYKWWAGPANPDVEEDYCVHCRCGDWGVTRYVDEKPDEQRAESIAEAMTGLVDEANARG